jgi:hypothetical protein
VDAATAPAQKCIQVDDFTAPVELPINIPLANGKAASLSSPRLTGDELTMYFTAPTADGRFQTYVVKRASMDKPFGTPQAVPTIDSGDAGSVNAIAAEAWVTEDDLTLIFSSSRASGKSLFTASRMAAADPFGAPQSLFPLPSSPTPPFYQAPYGVPAVSALYYVTQDPSDFTVRLAVREHQSGFGPEQPVLLDGKKGPVGQNQNTPVLSADGATLYFAASDPNSDGPAPQHVYMSARTGTVAQFGPAQPVTSLRVAEGDGPGWLSNDGCRLYLSRGTGGALRLLVATHAAH